MAVRPKVKMAVTPSSSPQQNGITPNAPRRVNTRTVPEDTIYGGEVSPTSTYVEVGTPAMNQQTATDYSDRSQGDLRWSGPDQVSGQLANPSDPFITSRNPALAVLAASAPVFIPGNTDPPPPPPPGQGGASTDSSPTGRSAEGGATSGSQSNGNTASLNDNGKSSATGGQNNDSSGPVIVSTPLPGTYRDRRESGKPKHVSKRTSPETHFVAVSDLHGKDFDDDQPMGKVKNLKTFQELVQKKGAFGLEPSFTQPPEKNLSDAYMFCDSLNSTRELFNKLQRSYKVKFISYEDFKARSIPIPDTVTLFSAHVTLTTELQDGSQVNRFSVDQVTEMAKSAAAKFGKVVPGQFFVVDAGEYATTGRVKFEVEYDSVADAQDAILHTNMPSRIRSEHASCDHIYINFKSLDAADRPSSSSGTQTPSPNRNGGEGVHFSPTGRTGWRDSNGELVTTTGYTKLPPKAGPYRNPNPLPPFTPFGVQGPQQAIYQSFDPTVMFPMLDEHGNPHPLAAKPQDVVDARIIEGIDCRTTLMIRNVPPEFTGKQLVDVLQDTVPGRYDFAYNRIDFRKNQSVGYAFINFTDTEALLHFVQQWRGKLLPNNIHRRHLRGMAVSYANTQGWDCLVAKFRNSAILDEAPGCRPKLFWSAETAPTPDHVGQEREWPPVDNMSKKHRSTENATINGLYSPRPRTGNGGRGGRRGQSQFDRGTTAQRGDENQTFNNYYNYGGFPSPAYGQFAQPRFQPPMPFDPNQARFMPPNGVMGQFQAPFQAPFPMQAPHPAVAPGNMLRTTSRGNLGYQQHPVIAADVAPVNSPMQAQSMDEAQFQPLLHPVRGQVPTYYRQV